MCCEALNFDLSASTLKPHSETRFTGGIKKFVGRLIRVGSLSQKTQGHVKPSQVTLHSAWLCRCSLSPTESPQQSRCFHLSRACSFSAIVCWTIEQKDNWSWGKSEKVRETEKQTGTVGSFTALKNLFITITFCVFFFNHRGCPWARDSQRPELFRKKKKSPVPYTPWWAVFLVERGIQGRRCPLLTQSLLCTPSCRSCPQNPWHHTLEAVGSAQESGEEKEDRGSYCRLPGQVWWRLWKEVRPPRRL